MVIKLKFCKQLLIVLCIKLKLKMFKKTYTKIKIFFDFSNYPKDSKYYNYSNNFFIGKMKHETNSVPIKGFVGLKSKMYTFIIEDNHESKKAKGIHKNVDDQIKYEDCKNILFNRFETYKT